MVIYSSYGDRDRDITGMVIYSSYGDRDITGMVIGALPHKRVAIWGLVVYGGRGYMWVGGI